MYSNLEFLTPLAESMTQEDPKKRPSQAIDEATGIQVQHFESILSTASRLRLCLPLRSVESTPGQYRIVAANAMARIRECRILITGAVRVL